MTVAVDNMEVKIVVSLENGSADELVVVTYFPLRRNPYRYTVTLIGGQYDGVEFLCRTEESAMWLNKHVLAALHTRWSWLQPIGDKSNDSARTQRIAPDRTRRRLHSYQQTPQAIRALSQGLPMPLRASES